MCAGGFRLRLIGDFMTNWLLLGRYLGARALLNIFTTVVNNIVVGAQHLINLEIPVLVRSLKSSNVELGKYLDGRLFKCCLSVAANP